MAIRTYATAELRQAYQAGINDDRGRVDDTMCLLEQGNPYSVGNEPEQHQAWEAGYADSKRGTITIFPYTGPTVIKGIVG